MDAQRGKADGCENWPSASKSHFGDEDESGESDDEDDGEMSEDDIDDEEVEEEGDADMAEKCMTVRGVKRQKLEELDEDSEVDVPAFADSDDDLERSSGDEEAEEADESSDDEDSAAGESGPFQTQRLLEKVVR